MTTQTPLDGRQAAVGEAARRLYDAEVALHIARQTGVSAWIGAAYDRLHEAIVAHNAALALAALPASPELQWHTAGISDSLCSQPAAA